jgi:putative ABC transport system permease protein
VISAADVIGLSFANLRQAKLRTALTVLGVSIGIASLAGMVSLGIGLEDQVVGRFTQSGVFGTITVAPQSDLPGALMQLGQRGFRRTSPAGTEPGRVPASLDDEMLRRIAALPNVRDVSPNLRLPLQLSYGEFSRGVTALGVPMSSKGEGTFQTIAHGRFFQSESENACLLGLDIAARMAEKEPAALIGKTITLSYAAAASPAFQAEGSPPGVQVRRVEVHCPVVGIIERVAGPMGGAGPPSSTVMIPLDVARRIFAEIVSDAESLLREPNRQKTYSTVTVRVTPVQFTQDVEASLRRMGYQAFSLDDALRGAKNAFIILNIFLALIGSIALTVSSLGIVNTMVMSILERTREIGIMKAIGASDSDIRRIFLMESSVIGLLGGLFGIALGWAAGRVINFGANLYIQQQGGTPGSLFSLPLWLIASALGFSLVVSLAAGSYPAGRAARLDPIHALRHD